MKSAARDLATYAIEHGYTVVVDIGDDEPDTIESVSVRAVMREATAVDECRFIFHKPGEKTESAYIVFGNAPDEEVADFSIDGMIDQWFETFF